MIDKQCQNTDDEQYDNCQYTPQLTIRQTFVDNLLVDGRISMITTI